MKKTEVPELTPMERKGGGKNQTINQPDPKVAFLSAAIDMSWQLALVVLVPIIGGFEIDQHTKTGSTFLIIGFLVAIFGFIVVIKNVLTTFNPNIPKNGGKA